MVLAVEAVEEGSSGTCGDWDVFVGIFKYC